MSFDENLARIRGRFDELSSLMASGDLSAEEFTKYSKEYAELDSLCAAIDELYTARQNLEDLQELLEDPESDKEMRDLATEELHEVKHRLPELEHDIQLMMLPKDTADEKNAILEIRKGTGGDEAAIFAGDLFEMYQRFAAKQNWAIEIIDDSVSEQGGYNEITAKVSGQGVFAQLKFESGVHRVQRVPQTESGGRIHTSAATVAVLPEAEEVDVQINEQDLRIDVMRAQGAGGQHVNTTDSAVRITHIPSGLVVLQQNERSQHKNKEKAMQVLRTRLYDLQRQEADAARAADRKSQVGSGDRSERIRTYNYPQGRVTDHRINLTLYKLDKVMAGEALEEIIQPLISSHQLELLAEISETQ